MRQIEIGNAPYDIHTVREGAQWRAFATRDGNRFGVEPTSAIEAEAIERLTNWLRWQHLHGEALATLQQAEQVYHRSLAERAFADQRSGDRSEQLVAVDAARAHLDVVRARRPPI